MIEFWLCALILARCLEAGCESAGTGQWAGDLFIKTTAHRE